MVKLEVYKNNSEIPTHINWQIVDFLRIVWPDGFQGENRLRNWASNEKYHPVIFSLVEKDVLVSHVAVVWKNITHNNIAYKVYSLSGLFTYPQFRKRGFGRQILKAAKKYMLEQDGDIIMIHSRLSGFYEKEGFEPMSEVVTLIGNPESPEKYKETAFIIFLSEKGKSGRKDFESTPFYFGKSMW